MFRKLQITFLLLFSFVIILVGGYNCAQKINFPDSGTADVYNNDDYDDTQRAPSRREIREYEDSLLPDEPSDNHCNRSQYKDLEDELGASAFVRFDGAGISDFRYGVERNFDLNCKRLYVNITERKRNYKGSISLSFEDGDQVQWKKYKTGFNDNENRYNKWKDRDKTPSNTGRLSSEFFGIFEDPSGAIILHINDLRSKDIRDGDTRLIGSGKIWLKMFRVHNVRNSDVCYRSGTYVSRARRKPDRPSARCWLLSQGPYSCKPQGARRGDFDLSDRDYDCYDELGTFGNLDVRKAFNVGSKEYPY